MSKAGSAMGGRCSGLARGTKMHGSDVVDCAPERTGFYRIANCGAVLTAPEAIASEFATKWVAHIACFTTLPNCFGWIIDYVTCAESLP